MRAPNDQYEMQHAPFSNGVANSNVRYYTTGTTHATSALPAGWAGRRVRVAAHTETAWVLFGSVSSLEVDSSLTAASPKLGYRIAAATYQEFWLPRDATHISVEAGGAGAVEVLLLSPEGTPAVP
jgi:hypothetical protein